MTLQLLTIIDVANEMKIMQISNLLININMIFIVYRINAYKFTYLESIGRRMDECKFLLDPINNADSTYENYIIWF